MSLDAFADDSVRRGNYMICVVTITVSDLARTRSFLRSMCAPGQRRDYFVSESDSRRRSILARMAALEAFSVVYVAKSPSQVKARTAIIETMVPDLRNRGVRRLVLDSREGQDHHDRSTIRQALSTQPGPELAYDHHPSASEPLLWIPDAVAWAWGRGGDWRRRAEKLSLVASVVRVEVS